MAVVVVVVVGADGGETVGFVAPMEAVDAKGCVVSGRDKRREAW